MALGEWEAEASKEAACNEGDFERAAGLLQARKQLEVEHAADFAHLLIDLVGPDAVDEATLV
jgi:hypothetical protein